MVVINTTYNKPTTIYYAKSCTRACHNKTCKHFNIKLEDKSDSSLAVHYFYLYKKNIEWLKNNHLGLSYVQMNLLLYVLLFPTLCIVLIIRLLKSIF